MIVRGFGRSRVIAVVVVAGGALTIGLLTRDANDPKTWRGEPTVRAGTEPELAAVRTRRELGAATVDRMRLANLEAKVASMERPVVPATPPSPPSAEERRRRIQEEYGLHEQLLAEHASKVRNDHWASAMENTIATHLRDPGGSVAFRYESAECRTDTCVVNLSWSDRASAETDLESLMGSLAHSHCARSIALPPDDGGQGTFRASAFVDCRQSGSRSGSRTPVNRP